MSYERKQNTGAFFKNDKGGNPNRPDYRGNLNVEGVEYWISGWIKDAKSGDKYMSLAVQPAQSKDGREIAKKPESAPEPFNDEIPF